MESPKRHTWLRRVLIFKVVVTLFVWGLPALFGPPALSARIGIPFPADPTNLRMFGALLVAAALLYWFAYQDPERNVAIIKFGVADNGLVSITIAVLAVTNGIESWFFWLTLVLTSFFCAAFALLMPRSQSSSA